jgi:hypothetical protein
MSRFPMSRPDGSLRTDALRAAHSPGIELLEYLALHAGHPLPADTQPNDLWYWQANLCSASPAAFESALRDSHAPLISTSTAELGDARLGWRKGLLTRDPDGHASLTGKRQTCPGTL